jgi:hypothetical protein
MSFKEYLEYLGIITLNIQYSATSTKTLEEVKNIVIRRVNKISSANDNIDVVCFVTDQHNGNKYIAYSKSMLDKYAALNTQWVLDLDMESINKLLKAEKEQSPTPICVKEVIYIKEPIKEEKVMTFQRIEDIEVEINAVNVEVFMENPALEVEIQVEEA